MLGNLCIIQLGVVEFIFNILSPLCLHDLIEDEYMNHYSSPHLVEASAGSQNTRGKNKTRISNQISKHKGQVNMKFGNIKDTEIINSMYVFSLRQ